MLTAADRQELETYARAWMPMHQTKILRAALADLDAAAAALRPVAKAIKAWESIPMSAMDRTYRQRVIDLGPDQADAVLAAAGGSSHD